ncbi:MAG: hypothetical protein JSS24_00335 [Proteobacteria bacterium]|nr:hypothetical protein [Pseudomonadota bacterium]
MSRAPSAIRGQASVEYLIGCLVVLALVAADAASGESTLSLVIRSIREGFTRFASALSIT